MKNPKDTCRAVRSRPDTASRMHIRTKFQKSSSYEIRDRLQKEQEAGLDLFQTDRQNITNDLPDMSKTSHASNIFGGDEHQLTPLGTETDSFFRAHGHPTHMRKRKNGSLESASTAPMAGRGWMKRTSDHFKEAGGCGLCTRIKRDRGIVWSSWYGVIRVCMARANSEQL